MSEWERNLRDSSSRQPAGDPSRYRYRSSNSIVSRSVPREESNAYFYGHSRQAYHGHSQATHVTDSSPRDIGVGRESSHYNRTYPGYRPQGPSSRTMATFRSYPSLGSINEESYRQPERSHAVYGESHTPESPRRQEYAVYHDFHAPTESPRRQEFAGPFADQRDQLIFDNTEGIVPSMELTDSSGSSTHSSISEATTVANDKLQVRYSSFPLDQVSVAPPLPPAGPIDRAPRSCPTIEVAPGEFLRLRGAVETSDAIQNDFYIPAECICCDQTLLCIQDADYVLCPDCRVVVPLRPVNERSNGGVGLGCKLDAVFPSNSGASSGN